MLVLMLSDERRSKKLYALPVRFISYKNLSDQYVRDFTREIKQHMTERGLALVGMCNLWGWFNSSQGYDKSNFIWLPKGKVSRLRYPGALRAQPWILVVMGGGGGLVHINFIPLEPFETKQDPGLNLFICYFVIV